MNEKGDNREQLVRVCRVSRRRVSCEVPAAGLPAALPARSAEGQKGTRQAWGAVCRMYAAPPEIPALCWGEGVRASQCERGQPEQEQEQEQGLRIAGASAVHDARRTGVRLIRG